MRKTLFSGLVVLMAIVSASAQTIEDKVASLIRELQDDPMILIIEDEVNVGIMTAPTGQEPNYQVAPKAQPGTPEYEAKIESLREKRRREIQQRIVALGPPAVPFVGRALGDMRLKYREYLAESLAMIADIRATPFLIDYLAEGLAKIRTAEALARTGETELAEQQRKEGSAMVMTATDALKSLTGKNFGTDVPAWKAWWDGVKANYR